MKDVIHLATFRHYINGGIGNEIHWRVQTWIGHFCLVIIVFP